MNRFSTWTILASMTCFLPPSALKAEVPVGLHASGVEIVVDLDTEVGEMYNFWNVYPVTVQTPFLEEQQFDQLRQTYRYAKYINCVRLLGGIDLKKDDYFRGVDDQGEAVCDFSEGLAMLSGIRKCGFTPWIVLDNVPAEMSENPTQNRYGNTEPPADFKLWSSYVRQFVQSLVDEFGREEVAKWRFRVGTEPDLHPGHWSGTKEQYLMHYDYTVAAILSALPDADIGPGNIIDPVKKRKWKSWGTEIIDHCATGTNHVTGQIGTPLGFFGSSYYTAVGTTDERFDDLVNLLRGKLEERPQFADAPVEIQEFGILSEGGKWIVGDGTEFGGSWLPHMADKIYRNRVRRVFQWWWNTNKGGDPPDPAHSCHGHARRDGWRNPTGGRNIPNQRRGSHWLHCREEGRSGRPDCVSSLVRAREWGEAAGPSHAGWRFTGEEELGRHVRGLDRRGACRIHGSSAMPIWSRPGPRPVTKRSLLRSR